MAFSQPVSDAASSQPKEGFIKKLQGMWFFPYLYWVLYKLHLEKFSRLSEQPEMLQKSRAYFTENQDKIQQVLAGLSDEKSRRVLKAQLSFRQYAQPLPLGSTHDHYFPQDIIKLGPQEVFVDCGAFTGDSIEQFQQASHNQYQKIIAFEAAPATFRKLQARKFKNCICLNCGVWHSHAALSFLSEGKTTDKLASAQVDRLSKVEGFSFDVPVVALDHVPECQAMTFLKMDIEGAELNALKGAQQLICLNRPTLAISIYHTDQDLLDIALWIMSLGLDYCYYMRHHGVAFAEVVFYAVPCPVVRAA